MKHDFPDRSAMARRISAHDWAATPLGAIETWPGRIKAVVELVLASPLVSTVALTDQRLLIYNDAAAHLYGDRHPHALGRPLAETFADSYPGVAVLYDRVFAGETVQVGGQPLAVGTAGDDEVFDAYLTPVRDDAGAVIGAHMVGLEIGTRLRTDLALRDSEERFRAFVTASADVVYRMSPDWSEMRQLEGRDFLHDTDAPSAAWLDQYIHPDDQELVHAAISRAIETRTTFELEHRVIRADGALGWTRSRAVPILDDRGEIREWLGAASDVTAAKAIELARTNAEAASRRAEARYLTLFKAIDQGFCTIEVAFDAQDRPTDYRFLEVSPSFERQTGIADAAGRWMRDIAPDQDQHWFDVYGRVARTGEPARFEDFSTPLGRWWEIFAFRVEQPEQHRLGVLFRDITERRRADAALRESEEHKAFLLELSDRLRAAARPQAVMTAAAELFARRLGLATAQFLSFQPDQERYDIAACYSDGRLSGTLTQGSGCIADHGPGWGDQFRRGEAIFSDDHDTRPAADAAAARAVGVQSGSAVPLMRDGRLVAIFATADTAPRSWTEAEKALQREVAERTWAAVERAQAETALREREADLARVQEIGAVGGVNIDVVDGLRGWRSPEYLGLHGLSPDTARENHADWLARVLPADRVAAEGALFQALEGDKTDYDSEYRIVRPSDGAVRWIHARADIERSADGTPMRLVGAHIDVTEQKSAQEALRESEERQAFLLELSDALRTLSDPAEVQREAMRVLGRRLGASRAQYYEADEAGEDVEAWRGYADGVPPAVGRFHLIAFGRYTRDGLQAGRTVVIANTRDHASIGRGEVEAYEELGVVAFVAVPIIRRGQFVGAVAIHQARARQWTDNERIMIEDVTERTRSAIEQARAEAALRETEERLQRFGEASQDVLWIRDAATLQWQYLTPAFETIYGLTREAALRGDNMTGWLELILPEDREHAARSIARVGEGEWVTFQFRIRRPIDGSIRWMRNTDFPMRDASGKVVRIGGIGHDVTELKEAEQAVVAAERRQRALLEGIPQLVWRANDGARWTWASPQWTDFTGQTEAESLDHGWLAQVHPDDRAGVLEVWKGAAARGEFYAEYRICHHGDLRYRWFQTRATPARDDHGTIIEWLGTSTDVEDLRGLQEHQQVLLAELQYRVRNILAIIRSIIRRSLGGEQPLQDYAQHLEGRITALARTQVLLTRHVNAHVDLEELIRDELTAQVADEARISIDGPDVSLAPKAAEVLALAMHELATNALKYGAIAHPDATLRVRWQVEDRDNGRWLTLVWSELGVPVPGGPPRHEGFGTELITRRVPYELKGQGELAIKSGGIVCTISFPLIDRASILESGSVERSGDRR